MSHIDKTIVSILEKIGQAQRSLMWDVAKKEKMSPVQIQFLIYINEKPDPMNKVSIIAREFDLTKATVSDAVNSLEEKKLIKKIREKDDKRSYMLQLTAKGRRVVGNVSNWSEVLIKQVSLFPEDEKKRVMLFLMELVKSLFDRGVINVARMCIACDNFRNNINPGKNKPHKCSLTGKKVADKDLNIGCGHFVNKLK